MQIISGAHLAISAIPLGLWSGNAMTWREIEQHRAGMVVAEEADPRARAGNGLGETFSFALVPAADGAVLAPPSELDSGGSIVKKEHIDTAVAAQAFALVMGEVTLGQSL
jgi:hypothetical protein